MPTHEEAITSGETAVNRYFESIKQAREQIKPMALGLYTARQKYPSNNAFGEWLLKSPYNQIGRDDRAALINLGQHWENVALLFAMTAPSTSPEVIWDKVKDAVTMFEKKLTDAAVLPSSDDPKTEANSVAGEEPKTQPTKPGKVPSVGHEANEVLDQRFTNGNGRKGPVMIHAHEDGAPVFQRILAAIKDKSSFCSDVGGSIVDIRQAWPYLPESFSAFFGNDIGKMAKNATLLDRINEECRVHGSYDQTVERAGRTFTIMEPGAAKRLGKRAMKAYENNGVWPLSLQQMALAPSRMPRKADWNPPAGVDVDPSAIGLIKAYGRVLFDPAIDDPALFLKVYMVYRFWQECDREWAIGTPNPKNRGLHWVKVCRFWQRFDRQAGYILWEIGTAMSCDPQLETETAAPMQALRLHTK